LRKHHIKFKAKAILSIPLSDTDININNIEIPFILNTKQKILFKCNITTNSFYYIDCQSDEISKFDIIYNVMNYYVVQNINGKNIFIYPFFSEINHVNKFYDLEYKGIDVSKYQQVIDWPTVAQNNYFAIIRAGYCFGHSDEYFETNYQNAKAVGVKVGAYWYAYASSASDAVQEANYAIQALKGKQSEWPIYYDIEEGSIFEANIQIEIAKAFCEVLEANKYYCGIYSSTNYLNNYFNDEVKKKFTIWVAHWNVEKPTYKGTYHVWQYTVGSTPGISGRCDLDKGYIDFEPIMKKNGLNGF
jgi:GH25 family lysozyme M1 (1,4-beta-N-acetylmuramidase)